LKGVKTLRVAIIGAGVSGLACAHELERHGIMPDIFEQRRRVGDLFAHMAVALQILHRPVKDQLKDLKENYHISLKPANVLKKITMHTPKVTGSIYGNLGYLMLKGQSENAVSNQLLKQVKSPVYYNTRAEYTKLAREYDYVVVATGGREITSILGCWEDVSLNWVMGSTVLGSFDPNAMMMWLNTEYAGSSYAYLTPFNRKSASLVLSVSNAKREEMGYYWKKFWQIEGFDYRVASLWDLEHVSGYVYPHQVGNILFVGNSGGFLEAFLGFALYSGLVSGVLAARSIAGGRDYESCLRQLVANSKFSVTLRRELNRLTNKGFDHLVALLTTPGIKQLVYNTNLDFIKTSAVLLDIVERARSLMDRKIETGREGWEKKP
jgi:digeranylgeranylglycerophospholipid reductase